MAKVRQVKTKGKCCKSAPRCKRCPVVLARLEASGHATRLDKRHYAVVRKLKPKVLGRARRRRLAG